MKSLSDYILPGPRHEPTKGRIRYDLLFPCYCCRNADTCGNRCIWGGKNNASEDLFEPWEEVEA